MFFDQTCRLVIWTFETKKLLTFYNILSQKMTIYDTFESNEDYLREKVLPTHFWLIT